MVSNQKHLFREQMRQTNCVIGRDHLKIAECLGGPLNLHHQKSINQVQGQIQSTAGLLWTRAYSKGRRIPLYSMQVTQGNTITTVQDEQ
ncbi:hypothetical protein Y1Q_0017941 [Alligator mississippiensis]|uniref:Uncharacterized protein n=1 Tax=Alligator mississippiensis TaxID=8496 RepID=A0A151MXW4_ALLMI|nr:hypothetical protein Y1Q_0017941 [Alligator mississippiensis]